jgi:oligopeptidase A
MENFCWERQSVDLFARHYRTDERIPDALWDKMLRARTYRGANVMIRQLGFATMDLDLHRNYEPARDGSLVAYARKIIGRFAATELPAEYAMVLSFGHLFSHPVGYAGGYYSYKWAEVLDADAFSRFATEGVFSREVGRAFREQILAKGDSRDPMELFQAFMGRLARAAGALGRRARSSVRGVAQGSSLSGASGRASIVGPSSCSAASRVA